jgi:hypothetical protein
MSVTSDTAGYNTAVTTINVAAGQGQKVMLYDIYKNGVTSEYFLVTAISTDALTVVRGAGGTTAATVPAAATTFKLHRAGGAGARGQPARHHHARRFPLQQRAGVGPRDRHQRTSRTTPTTPTSSGARSTTAS